MQKTEFVGLGFRGRNCRDGRSSHFPNFCRHQLGAQYGVMQASNENFIYELQFARTRDIVSSPGLASIYVRHRSGEELSAEEQERFYWDKMQELGTWELAFNRHRDGLFSTRQWQGWDEYFKISFPEQFSVDSWAEVRNFYAEDFQTHIDAAYAEKKQGLD